MILPYILKDICWKTSSFEIMSQCDTKIDLIMKVGHSNLNSMSGGFASYLEDCFIDEMKFSPFESNELGEN